MPDPTEPQDKPTQDAQNADAADETPQADPAAEAGADEESR